MFCFRFYMDDLPKTLNKVNTGSMMGGLVNHPIWADRWGWGLANHPI